MLVDDNREEHRMMIFGNDSQLVQERLIADTDTQPSKILAQKVHADSYTVTLYVLLKDYGLTPVFRIKPRIRFRRSNYDNLSSSAPLRYNLDDIVHFAELKRGIELTEKLDDVQLAKILGDSTGFESAADDTALHFVSQRNVFLRNPPFKTKTKVFGKYEDVGLEEEGIQIGTFLDALNQPNRTEQIFKDFARGTAFARDLRDALAPYEDFEFQFGIYSRYERRDCVLAAGDAETSGNYRATFDPWTSLGYIRTAGDAQQFQILAHERGTRWEHKVMLDQLDTPTRKRLATEIPALRREYLIGRVLSKSQTALTRLAHLRESYLSLATDLHTGYTLRLEVPIPKKRFSVIEHRRKLRRLFNGNGTYRLHPLNGEFVERHSNMAKGIRNGVVWSLDSVELLIGHLPLEVEEDGFRLIRSPIPSRMVVRSAEELRERLPEDGFERCWNEAVDIGGYTVLSRNSGRVYNISYGRRNTGCIHEDTILQDAAAHYLSIEYLGIEPTRTNLPSFAGAAEVIPGFFDRFFRRRPVPPLFRRLIRTEAEIISEMKTLGRHCKEKLKIQ